MIKVSIPDFGDLQLEHLVLDYNGTIAFNGDLYKGVDDALIELSELIQIHVLTADTFGEVKQKLGSLPVTLSILPEGSQDQGKLNYIQQLGKGSVCIGNGRNDRFMLKESALGIALIQEEGAYPETLLSADIVCTNILSALELLKNPKRMIATLRL